MPSALGNTTLDTQIVVTDDRNIIPYETGLTSSIALSPATTVYRVAPALSETTLTIPTPTMGNIPAGNQYFCFELEVTIPATPPATLNGPTGWVWVDRHQLPDPAKLVGGETIYIACRLDCAAGARSVLASVWRVA